MSSFDKVVKNACKPKAAPPKAKYLDPIISATWSEDGAVHDVCKALAPRIREPNAIVVFKALIVLHTMIRNGATDNVLQYLSSSDVLRLKNVAGSQWEGYNAPQNLQNYSTYLDGRIRAYRDLKHDAIRVQSETNRDMRLSMSLEEDARRSGRSTKHETPAGSVSRSKTVVGRKLRVMTVEKGLLRETKIVQKMIDSLVECRFYLDDLEDELSITALRMLVKDLLILFQAGNEGVINVLEHYFEMSHVDAESALSIYRHFCKQTEYVVEYLGVAKKLQNLLNVPIPNLKHAPVSLVGSLEEYLNDPNFEQNRIEYKTNKDAADKNAKASKNGASKKSDKTTSQPAATSPTAASSSTEPPRADTSKAFTDFFSAIEEEQQTIFNPQTGSPTSNYFQQHATYNPFNMNGNGAVPGAFPQGQVQAQPTGFLQPQFTAVPAFQQAPNPFGAFQPQPTGFLHPQSTGANPFRQSTLFPQATGQPFQQHGQNTLMPNPTGNFNPFPSQQQAQQPLSSAPSTQSSFPFLAHPSQHPAPSPFAPQPQASNGMSVPARPASTPITSLGAPKTSSPPLQAVKSHQTGSRNPFGAVVQPAPPVPKPPTLFELSMGYGWSTQNQPQYQQPVQTQQTGATNAFGGSNGFNGSSAPSAPQQISTFTSVASSFVGQKDDKPNPVRSFTTGSALSASTQSTATTTTGSNFSDSVFGALSSQPTGATSNGTGNGPTSAFSSTSALKPQMTGGFGGLKAFKPSSSFGASLLESLPPIPQSAPGTPAASAQGSPALSGIASSSPIPSITTGSAALNSFSAQPTGLPSFSSQPFGGAGSSLGVGLRPQLTGAGGANPFRASMLAPNTGTASQFGTGGAVATSNSSPSLFAPSTGVGAVGAPSFGASLFSGAYSQNPSGQPQQQQNGQAPLI